MKPKKDNKKKKTHLKKFLTTVKRNKEHKSASAERFLGQLYCQFLREIQELSLQIQLSVLSFLPRVQSFRVNHYGTGGRPVTDAS